MAGNYITKDSGRRETLSTGAMRDIRVGKGRFDLISPVAERRVAGVYERGAVKYADRNWEKGMPISRFLDSAKRHISQYIENALTGRPQDEDHLAQAYWNLAAAMHMEELMPEMNDLLKYGQEWRGKRMRRNLPVPEEKR